MKKIVYIGSRQNCLKALQDRTKYEIVRIYAEEGTRLATRADVIFTKKDKEEIFEQLKTMNYDILVSNGCPFILPASELISQGKMLINTHPTYLPHLRGATPLNGVLYKGYSFMGATTHYISDKIDAGNIIYQEKVDVTEDIDLGLVYEVSFTMEEVVFCKAMAILEENNFQYEGHPMSISEGCYFNRSVEKRTIDIINDNIETCIRKIKAFGLHSQGALITIDDTDYKLYSAERIVNPFLLKLYSKQEIGKICLKYDDNMIIKLIDGIIKVTKYTEEARTTGGENLNC